MMAQDPSAPHGHTRDNLASALQLRLGYHHAHGWLSPFLRGLLVGEAWSTRCRACGRCFWPPHRQCPRDSQPIEWHQLSGSGVLLQVTQYDGPVPFTNGAMICTFGLVGLDGADNAMLARIGIDATDAVPGMRVRLAVAPPPVVHPAQAAWFLAEATAP